MKALGAIAAAAVFVFVIAAVVLVGAILLGWLAGVAVEVWTSM